MYKIKMHTLRHESKQFIDLTKYSESEPSNTGFDFVVDMERYNCSRDAIKLILLYGETWVLVYKTKSGFRFRDSKQKIYTLQLRDEKSFRIAATLLCYG